MHWTNGSVRILLLPQVIVGDLDLWASLPIHTKQNSPLIVDPDPVLAGAVPLQCLETIAGEHGADP